ncbi:MAG: hypothetical protein HND58_10675 [Planctomycetota bacterium]|nr:MAG: hypothetical protein HND58_10675 [Planctomycetota bacterium]
MTPNAHVSDRLSTRRPRACSGLMYAAVPRIAPAMVGECCGIVGRVERRARGTLRLVCARKPEVEHLGDTLGCDHDVGGLEIAVDHPGLVRGLDPGCDLYRQLDRLINRQRPAVEAIRERLAIHELEDEVLCAVLFLDTVDPGHVWMVQARHGLGLALEACKPDGVLGQVFRKGLYRDVSIQTRITGEVHHTHPAPAHLTKHLIRADGLAHGGIVASRGNTPRRANRRQPARPKSKSDDYPRRRARHNPTMPAWS